MPAGLGGLLSSSSGAGEAVGVGAGLDDGAIEREPVDDGHAEARVSERLRPAAEGIVGGDRDAVLLLAFGQDLEEELGAVAAAGADRVRSARADMACAGEARRPDAVLGRSTAGPLHPLALPSRRARPGARPRPASRRRLPRRVRPCPSRRVFGSDFLKLPGGSCREVVGDAGLLLAPLDMQVTASRRRPVRGPGGNLQGNL